MQITITIFETPDPLGTDMDIEMVTSPRDYPKESNSYQMAMGMMEYASKVAGNIAGEPAPIKTEMRMTLFTRLYNAVQTHRQARKELREQRQTKA